MENHSKKKFGLFTRFRDTFSKLHNFVAKHPLIMATIKTAVPIAFSLTKIKVFNIYNKNHSATLASSKSNGLKSDVEQKKDRKLPAGNDVAGHKQRYHTNEGVVWKNKKPYHRDGR